MPKNKPASKRVAMKVKYAVKKRVRDAKCSGMRRLCISNSAIAHNSRLFAQVQEHDRKQRRMAKKNPSKYGKKITKDPGIPNLYPFKAQLLERVSSVFACCSFGHLPLLTAV